MSRPTKTTVSNIPLIARAESKKTREFLFIYDLHFLFYFIPQVVEHKKDFDSLVASIRERMRKQKEAAAKGSERPTTRTTTETTTDVEEIIKIDDDDDEIKGEASSAKGALVSSTEEGIHSSGQEGNVAAFPRSQDSENSSTWSSQSSANGEAGEKRKRKKRSSQPDRPEGAEPDSPVSPEGGRRRSARLTKENPTD